MKALASVLGVAGLMAVAGLAGCAASDADATTSATHAHAAHERPAAPAEEVREAPQAAAEQKLCPVMGLPIDKDVYVDHEGRRVYFCCKACAAKFQEDPATYLPKLDEQLAG